MPCKYLAIFIWGPGKRISWNKNQIMTIVLYWGSRSHQGWLGSLLVRATASGFSFIYSGMIVCVLLLLCVQLIGLRGTYGKAGRRLRRRSGAEQPLCICGKPSVVARLLQWGGPQERESPRGLTCWTQWRVKKPCLKEDEVVLDLHTSALECVPPPLPLKESTKGRKWDCCFLLWASEETELK